MNHITLNKRPGESYKPHASKVYDVKRNGEVVGTVAQDLYNKWEVVGAAFNRISHHTTIKAAVRVAARAL